MPEHRPGRYVPSNEQVPDPRPVTDVVVTRFDHIYEVDPSRMGTYFQQQQMPPWDSLRIAADRWDHIRDIHGQWADEIVLAGQGSELDVATESGPDTGTK